MNFKCFTFVAIHFIYLSALNAEILSKNDIAIDSSTGLIWQDDKYASTVKKEWRDARRHCENMLLGGHDDWRLPSIYELMTLIDNHKTKEPYIVNGFKNGISGDVFWGGYWSSTENEHEKDFAVAYYVRFNYGTSIVNVKDSSQNVRCVRGRELGFEQLRSLRQNNILKVGQDNINNVSPKDEAKRVDDRNKKSAEWAAKVNANTPKLDQETIKNACRDHYMGRIVKFRGGALNIEWTARIMGVGDGVVTIKNIATGSIQETSCSSVY